MSLNNPLIKGFDNERKMSLGDLDEIGFLGPGQQPLPYNRIPLNNSEAVQADLNKLVQLN